MKLNFLTDEIITENLNLDKFALCDGDGLYLVKQKATSRPAFLTKFRIDGKIKTKTIGFYGNLTLNQARAERDKIKLDIKRPADITTISPENEPAADVLHKYLQNIFNSKNTEKSRQAATFTIQKYIAPFLENKKINEVKATDIKQILDAVITENKQGRAEQVLMRIKGLFKFAMINNNLSFNPSKTFTKQYIYKNVDNRHSKLGGRVLDAEDADAANEYLKFLNAVKSYSHGFFYRNIFILLTILCVRKNELTEASWSEFDFEKNIWHLPANRTKTRQAIDIPLPALAVKILLEFFKKRTNGKKVLPNLKTSSKNNISDSTLWRVIQRVCERNNLKPFSPHSYRKTSRTLLSSLGVETSIAERCLNHAVGDKMERTYNKDKFFEPRKQALNKLADYINKITSE